MLQFSCTFAFKSTFRLSNRTTKITLAVNTAGAVQYRRQNFDQILYECKGYNA